MSDNEVKNFVRERYAELARSGDCCCPSCGCSSSAQVAASMGYSEEDVRGLPEEAVMGLGCGNPVALAGLMEGDTVLDLGSGAGMDVFLASRKVGGDGRVIGVDMTEEMVERARSAAMRHGYENVEFRLGMIEDLPIDDESMDVVISNCVINLAIDKEKVFKEAYRVLKPGGRLTISDIVTEEELPEETKRSLKAWAECIAGAIQKESYLEAIRAAGFKDVKVTSESTYDIDETPELQGKIKSIQVEAHKTKT